MNIRQMNIDTEKFFYFIFAIVYKTQSHYSPAECLPFRLNCSSYFPLLGEKCFPTPHQPRKISFLTNRASGNLWLIIAETFSNYLEIVPQSIYVTLNITFYWWLLKKNYNCSTNTVTIATLLFKN